MEKLETPMVAGVGGVAVLAALLSFGGGSTKKPAVPPNAPAAKQSSSNEVESGTAPNQEGPWRAICDEYAPNGAYRQGPTKIHRGYQDVRIPSNAPEGATESTTKQDANGQSHKIVVHKQLVGDLVACIPKSQLSGIHLIIATLPDPDKTEMRLKFDRYVDALESAAATRSFYYVGYWFPWSPHQTTPAPRKEGEVEAALLRTEQPGVLLFHNLEGERLFIFVVGETPTSGINRLQMTQALRYRQSLIDASHKSDKDGVHRRLRPASTQGPTAARLDGPLMVSGPHFSGSLVSLAEVLQDSGVLKDTPVPTPRPSVEIISPDVSSDELIDHFRSSCNPSVGCIFRSLTITAKEKDKRLGSYLKSLGYEENEIAKLIEDESAFGASAVLPGYKKTGPFGLVLTFPRELSAARSLSDQKSEQLAESGAKLLSLSKNSLDIKLASPERNELDRPATYAADAEVSEISSALENDVRVLREKNIQCIVVSATNPLDRIFLLEYIRDRLPNIRAVTVDADELEVRHPHFIDLTGTIVIGSLPTVPERVAVKDEKRSFISFRSAEAEEQFLSTAILLDPAVTKRDITEIDNDDQDAVLNADIRPNGPWISIAGEEGFELIPFNPNGASAKEMAGKVPVFGKDDEMVGKSTETAKNSDGVALEIADLENTPRIFIYFSISIFLLTALHLIRLLNSERPKPWNKLLVSFGCGRKNDRPLKFAYVETDIKEHANRTFSLLALDNQIFLLNCLVLAGNPISLQLGKGLIGLQAIAVAGWIMAAVMLVVLAVSLKRYCMLVLAVPAKVPFLFFSFMMLWYLVSSVVFLCFWHVTAITEWRRILALNSGLSPIVPIAAVLLAWVLLAALQLRGVRWIAHRKMDLLNPPITVEENSMAAHIRGDMEAIHGQIDSPTMGVRQVLFVLLFVGVVSSLQWTSLRSIEPYRPWGGGLSHQTAAQRFFHVPQLFFQVLFPPSFEWWFGIWGLVMLLMTVMQTTYQLYQMWKSLACLLRRLEQTSMKRAFEQIGKDDRVHIKLWDLGKAQLRFDEMALIIESLCKMNRITDADKARKALDDCRNADLEGRQSNQTERDRLNEALNVCIPKALEQLEDKHTGGSDHISWSLSSPPWRDSGSDAEELDRYLALRLSTLVRYVLLQMRNLMWFVIYGYFLAIVSVTFYPFQGGKNLSDMLAVAFMIVLVIMAMLVTEVSRNPMLKRLEDGESSMAGILQAVFHLFSVGGLPALALLAWQFPSIGQIVFSWLRPFLSTFR